MSEKTDLLGREAQKHEYQNARIVVSWEPELCTHATMCIQNLPEVFRPRRRPWVRIGGATPEEIARVVELCPSLALKYRLLEQEPPHAG